MDEADVFLRKGLNLEGQILAAGASIRESSKNAYEREWLDARLMLASIISSTLEVKAGVPGATTESTSERLTLVTAYLQGLPATEAMISEGQYIKAAAALKQDLEIVTRIREVRNNVAIAKKVPNMKHAPEGAGRFYGDLNSIAHPSTLKHLQENVAQLHDGGVHGVSPIPFFNKDMGRSMYELHVWLTLELVREQIILFAEMYGQDDAHLLAIAKWFQGAVGMLQKAGFQVIGPDDDDDLPGSA